MRYERLHIGLEQKRRKIFFLPLPEETEDESVLHLSKEDTCSSEIRGVTDIQYVSEFQSVDNPSNRKLDQCRKFSDRISVY